MPMYSMLSMDDRLHHADMVSQAQRPVEKIQKVQTTSSARPTMAEQDPRQDTTMAVYGSARWQSEFD